MSRALVLAALLSIFAPGDAHAQWGWMGYPQFYGRNVYTVYDQDRLPYFALHPPVYYSRAVPRTFGYSPFAYPGIVQTPDVAPAGPEMVVNPFIEQLPSASGSNGPTAPNGAPTPAPVISPSPKAGPLQGFKPPKANSKGGVGAASKADKSASAVPHRIVNPHFERTILNASATKLGR
ncbi:MAG: hypothetical protein K8U03_04730 [Planctomycetia bacterium]|nr:hypothetical protein [Planctomycetia bacterium]